MKKTKQNNTLQKLVKIILLVAILVGCFFVVKDKGLQGLLDIFFGNNNQQEETIQENGNYDSKEDVALYIHTFGHLPNNYMTKKEAQAIGWEGGALSVIKPGYSIGGDVYSNYEKLLPTKKGRTYYECDINTQNSKKRGEERIIFSNDGLIYYTNDHYESFELLYGEE